MVATILSTKIRPPLRHPDLVVRQRLVDQLNQGLACKLTLVSAPAGFGKTTLINEWINQEQIPAAWVSLEESDKDAFHLLSYLVAALQTIMPAIDMGELDAFYPAQPQPVKSTLAILLNKISAESTRNFALILDDYHLVDGPRIQEIVSFILEHLPYHMHLVIATRADPSLPLARYRGRGEMVELRQNDLRFTTEEALEFLNRMMGLSIPPGEVWALTDRTEGWIAGLQMAAISMKTHEDIPGFIQSFTGTHRYILDYLIEEVLGRQPPHVQNFLLHTSILDTFTASLCDAVAYPTDSNTILHYLERANLFIVPLDDERRWYRYHQLFAELLRKRLSERYAALVPVLHIRASEWFETQGFLHEAILHALEAMDIERVTRLVTANTLLLAERHELAGLLERLNAFPSDQIETRPWLCVAVAWVMAYAGQLEHAEQSLSRLQETLQNARIEGSIGLENNWAKEHLSGHCLAIQAYIYWIRGEAERAVASSRLALQKLPLDDLGTRANTQVTLGLALQFQSDLAGANQAFTEAIVLSREANNFYQWVYAASCQAFCLILEGKLRNAFAVCQGVQQQANHHPAQLQRSPVLGICYATQSIILRHWNELNESLAAAQEGVALAERWNQADTLQFSLTCLADTYLALNDFDRARQTLERAKPIARSVSSWFVEISEKQEAEINLASGNVHLAAEWMQENLASKENDESFFLLFSTILMAQGRYREALGYLNRGVDRLNQPGSEMFLKTTLVKALILQSLEQVEPALQALDRVLTYAEPEGYIQIFVSKGEPMVKLLCLAKSKGIAPRFVEKLLSAFVSAPVVPGSLRDISAPAASQLAEPLSQRECEVLDLLATGLTAIEIAEKLFVSESTIRTHTKHIYAKLGVNRRMEAIQRAREVGLL